jgi:tetratricopeptide (TPR) repeat protein
MRFIVIFVAFTGMVWGSDSVLDRASDRYRHTDYAGAEALLLPAQTDSRALMLLGQCYFREGDYKKATDTLEKAAALRPNDSLIQTWLGRAYGRRAETSFALIALGYVNRTRESLERAVALNPWNGEAIDDLFDFYLQAPAFVGGNLEKARKLLPLIARIDPAQEQFALAHLDEQRKDFKEAEARLRKAMELSPAKLERVLELARFLAQCGRFDESEQYFAQAERMQPHSPRILYARADVYVASGRNLPQARECLRTYLASRELTPDDPSRQQATQLLRKAQGS